MYVEPWIFWLLMFGLPILGGILHHQRAYVPFEPPDPHPVLGWLGAIAVFAGGFVASACAVHLVWPAHWPTSLLGLAAYWLG